MTELLVAAGNPINPCKEYLICTFDVDGR